MVRPPVGTSPGERQDKLYVTRSFKHYVSRKSSIRANDGRPEEDRFREVDEFPGDPEDNL